MPETTTSRAPLFYLLAILFGIFSGLLHVTVQDPLLTALAVTMATMFLGFMRPLKPWRWTLIVGLAVPIVMIAANLAKYYVTLTRAGIYGSVLIMLPGFAGAYGGMFGRMFMKEMFGKKEEPREIDRKIKMDNAREESIEQRRHLQAQYGELFDSTEALLFRHDPIGINFEDNTDEYEAEVRTILPRLNTCHSVPDVQKVVHEEFVRWFDDQIAGPPERYAQIAFELWEMWMAHQASK